MKEITIKVTPDQEKWLKHFAEFQKEGARDNLGTSKPIHIVETRDEKVIFDNGDSGDQKAYFDIDTGGCYETVEEILEDRGIENFLPYEEAYIEGVGEEFIWNEFDYLKAYGVKKVEKVSINYTYRPVSYHFTLQSAREYIKYQGHNLKHPRTFTATPGYGHQGDYEHLFDFMMSAGTFLLEFDQNFTNEDYVDPEWGIQGRCKK